MFSFNRLKAKKTRRIFIKCAINGILICLLIILFTNFSRAETDVTEEIELVKSRLMYDRLNKISYLDVGLKNIGQGVLLTPIKVVIDNISPSAVTVANADGTTENGIPYFRYDYPLLEKGQLDPEETSPVKRFRFNNPNIQRFSYTTKIMALLPAPDVEPIGMPTPEETLSCAAKAIEDGEIEEALKMFDKGAHNKIEDSLNSFDNSDLKELSSSLSKAQITNRSERRITYEMPITVQTEIREQVKEEIVHFYIIKLSSGNWVIEDL